MTAALFAALHSSTAAASALPSPAASYDFRATSNVLPAGAALSRSSTATYQNKQGVYATAANNEPRIEWGLSAGTGAYCKGLLIEPASANIVKNSNDLTAATWGKSVVTVSGNGAAGPYGNNDLAKLTNGTSNWNEVYQQIPVTAGNAYAITSHVRQGTLDKFIVAQMTELGPGYGAACFDIAGGIVGNKFSVDWTVQSASIEPMADGGLFRLTVVAIAGSTKTSNIGHYLQAINTDGIAFQADNGATGFLGHVQVEEIPAASVSTATYPTSYIQNTSGSASATRAADAVTVFFGATAQSLTGNGSTATFTAKSPHGFANGDSITIAGATPSGFNGTVTITVTGPSTFTYGSAASGTATGTVTAYYASKAYDIFVTDPAGSEWRKNVTVTSGTYTLQPRAKQRYVTTVKAWVNGVLSSAQQDQVAGTSATPVYVAPSGIGGAGVDKTSNGWTLTFLDDFDGVVRSDLPGSPKYFDQTKWTSGFAPVVYGQDNGGDGSRFLGGNVEQQYYLDADYAGNSIPVANRINPFKFDKASIMGIETGYIPDSLQASYWSGGYRVFYSGCLTTCTKFSQQYGLFEAKIKMAPGLGAWPAFWMLPQTKSLADYVWPPEIDIIEAFPKLRPNQVHQGIIITSGSGDGPTPQGWNNLPNNASNSDGFHIYSLEWNPQTITWYIDYVKIGSCPTPANFTYPMYLLVNCAVGGEWYRGESGAAPGDYDALVRAYRSDTSQLPYRTEIDWVRAYSPGAFVTPPSSPPPASNESPNDTTIPPSPSITDSKQNTWTVNAGVVYVNGASAAISANVTLLLYHNHVVYQTNGNGWWSWDYNASNWVQVPGDPRSTGTPTTGGTFNCVTVGDSITEGLLFAGAFRPALDSLLRGAGYSPTWIGRVQDGAGFHHEGYDGYGVQDPTGGIAGKLSGMALSSASHATLMLGTNDISGYAPGSPVSAATEATRLGNLIDSLFAQNANLKLVVMNLTPRGDGIDVTPLNALIPNLVNTRASAGKNIVFCDVYTGYPTSNGYGTGDGDGALHPNQTGYNFIAQQLFAAIKKFGTVSTGATGGSLTSPVAGYNSYVFGGNFGTGKTTSDAVTTIAGFSKVFGQKLFWQPYPGSDQITMQTDHVDLTAFSGRTVFVESNFQLSLTKNYYVEGRFKIPTNVPNLVPAFWVYANSPDVIAGRNGGETHNSEVDFFETFYSIFGNQNQLFFTTHTDGHANVDQKIVDTGSPLGSKYVTVGCELRLAANQVVWWINGVKQATFSYTWRSAPPAIILDIDFATLVGGSAPAASDMPQSLSVDYVRAWSE